MDFDENRYSVVQREGGAGGRAVKAADASDFESDLRQSRIMRSRRPTQVTLDSFELRSQLGRGTFGKVFLAGLRATGEYFAIKVIRKDVLLEYDQVESTLLEKDILFAADHPFLVGMDFLFQSETRLYFVMPFIRGGELYKIFLKQKRLPERVVKFYAAQIVVAVGELHKKGIMHRDLKLENILVDEKGYIKIIDYGLAKIMSGDDLA